jgi:hypothetical protein
VVKAPVEYATSAELQVVANEINSHERECAERYKRIELQLTTGEKRFARVENMLWGLYILLITSTLLPSIVAQVGGSTG